MITRRYTAPPLRPGAQGDGNDPLTETWGIRDVKDRLSTPRDTIAGNSAATQAASRAGSRQEGKKS